MTLPRIPTPVFPVAADQYSRDNEAQLRQALEQQALFLSAGVNEVIGAVEALQAKAHGEISAENNAIETVISTINVWVQVTVFDTNGLSKNATPDHTNDHITVDRPGVYAIAFSASVLSGVGAGAVFECEARLNNGATSLPNVHWDRALTGGGGDVGSTSGGPGLVTLAAGDTVEVWVRNKTNTTNITFENIALTIQEK